MSKNRTKAIMHFNKPGAARKDNSKKTPWSVHWRGSCYQVLEIKCKCPMKSEWRPDKSRSPRAFFTAMVKDIKIKNKTAILT